ncbi:MAG: 23S rRNA (guanosine(2251)-2'-O)-methyltransferase RlmB [Flavobacteriales bacterium]|nr:23S rRNA (guanosine(2251)-2'-O)-methyltransferase RlmB [Flavobacteriales bacterium]
MTDKDIMTLTVFGIRPLIEAISSGKIPDRVFIQRGLRGDNVPELMGLMKGNDIAYKVVPEEKLNRLTRDNHQGVFAFMSPIEFASVEGIVDQKIENGENPLVLILDHLTDVRNFGAIVRTAECTGVCAVVIASEGAAPISADAVKASAGAIFRVPICKSRHLVDTVYYLQQSGLKIVGATEKTDTLVYNTDMTVPTAIIMGNEEKGISKGLMKLCDAKAKLPLSGEIGSLNVSVACGAVLYEAVRQRMEK